MADLNGILTGLDETVIAQEIELKVDMALKNFPVSSPIVSDYPEAEEITARFYQYVMSTMFGATVSDTLARGFVSLFLSRAYPAGIDDAADVATTGVQGGILDLLRKVAEGIKKQLVQQYTGGTISAGVNLASWDDRVNLMESYVNQFASNVPASARRKTAMELASHAEEMIASHMQIASYFRKKLGR